MKLIHMVALSFLYSFFYGEIVNFLYAYAATNIQQFSFLTQIHLEI